MKQVLVVDDEVAIATLLEYNLTQAHYAVTVATDGEEAVDLITTQPFDFVVLDLMLPGMDGFDVTKTVRQAGIDVPILMLTARDTETDKIIGLELGADDYVTKPFSPREIIARMKAIERRQARQQPVAAAVRRVGALTINQDNHRVMLADRELNLTKREYELLLFLAQNTGRTVTRDELIDRVWGFEYVGQTRMVDMQISKLRDKLEEDPRQPRYIQTVRGFGYRLEEPTHDKA